MKPMNYKGYSARIEYSDEDECFVGHIAGIKDIVGFHGESVEEIRKAFIESVDGYLAACEEFGRQPQRPYSGRVTLRLPPELHAQAALKAEVSGASVNEVIVEAVREAMSA